MTEAPTAQHASHRRADDDAGTHDNDVAVTVRTVLLYTGHECWTAAEANLHDAPDDALAVYSADRSAALVSHDAEFAVTGSGTPSDRPSPVARWR